MIAMLLLAAAAECIVPSGDRILARDLARSAPAFARLAPDTVIGYAPQPGAMRRFEAAELAQWLTRHGVSEPVEAGVCFAWKMEQPSAEAMRAAMQSVLPPSATLQIAELSQRPVAPGRMEFALSDLRRVSVPLQPALWKGYVWYLPGARQEVWARVHIQAPFRRVVLTRHVRAGEVLDEACIRVETGEGPLLPAGIAREPHEVLGRLARRYLASGSPVMIAALDQPPAVRRGDLVQVSVVAGAARIGLEGLALAAAAPGGMVSLRITETGRTIRARVESAGRAVLDLNH